MPEPLTLAFLGCGRITARHAGVLRKVPGINCRFASRNAGRAAEFNRQLGGSGSYGSYQAAIDDESVDAIVVATPPDTHLELALAALGAGRHAVIEKPAFMHSSDVDMVAAAATSAGRLALVAENYRYRPLLGMLRDMLTERAVGDVRLIQIDAV
ncbi:MAG TPA: Gfo/Idh/MocA family oxidoreductase, partial [Gemmatimonadales bacterium]|nr:Gfo/Idh/MocA family oxidoreductase [Gemmatimonadales bacterium]